MNFDFVNSKVVMPSSAPRFFYKGLYYDLPRGDISFADYASSSFIKMLINTQTYTIKFMAHNVPHSDRDVLIAIMRNVSGDYRVWMNGDYKINGVKPYATQEDVETYVTETIGGFISEADDINLLRYNLEDCINSWWVYPLAKRYVGYRDKTYLGYTDSQGFSGVASIDNVSGQIVKKRLKLTKNDVDDHSAPCVDIMPDGRIISAYPTGHKYDNFMHVRISSKFESVEEFDEDIIIEANNTTTYSQLFYKK